MVLGIQLTALLPRKLFTHIRTFLYNSNSAFKAVN